MSIHPRTNRFPTFIDLYPGLNEKTKVLDFGGNRGNLLYFSNYQITESNYTSVDVSYDSLLSGKKDYPNANWIYYNRKSFMYNNYGSQKIEFPNIDNYYDVCFAFSVFTHTDFWEKKRTINWLKTKANTVLISFLDIEDIIIKNFFYEKRTKDYGKCIDFVNQFGKILYLIDNDLIYNNVEQLDYQECNHFLTFYNKNFLQSVFPDAEIIISKNSPHHPFLRFKND